MAQDYRYISENTLQYVYLHDCDCSHLCYLEGRLIFVMEWMEILREHPLNPFGQAHQTGAGRIELIHPKIVECTLAMRGDGEIQRVCDVRELDYSALECLKCEETCLKDGDSCTTEKADVYCADCYMLFDRDSCYYDLSLRVEYVKSLVMWDAFHDVSWFERE